MLKMLKVKIAIPSKDGVESILLTSNPKTKEDIDRLKNEEIAVVDVFLNIENKYTLTEFGNKMIEESKNDYDYLILMHSDVYLSLYEFVKRLADSNRKYNVVGVAGTKKLNISQSPLTWFTGSHRFPDDRYGRIIHECGELLAESFFNKNKHADVSDTEVLTIDGLLMCLDKKTMQSENVRFDTTFTYDFYDLDFCLNVQTNTELKIGVFVIQTIHKSLGKSVLTEEYLIPERKFRMKYQKFLA